MTFLADEVEEKEEDAERALISSRELRSSFATDDSRRRPPGPIPPLVRLSKARMQPTSSRGTPSATSNDDLPLRMHPFYL